jgi:hypothetical protein
VDFMPRASVSIRHKQTFHLFHCGELGDPWPMQWNAPMASTLDDTGLVTGSASRTCEPTCGSMWVFLKNVVMTQVD